MLKTVRVPEKFAPLFEQAQSYVMRYFADQVSAPERGTLEISGQRYVLVRAASMSVEFHAMVRRLYQDDAEAVVVARALLFDVAHAMGLADARAFAERMAVTDPMARLSAGPVHFAHAGWAFVDISGESRPSPDDDYYLLFDHPSSFESDAWLAANKSANHPVCVMNAGYSSGWCEHSFGLPLVATEILCRAKGDEACRFIMSPASRMEDHVARYTAGHPELAARVVNYHVPGFFSQRTDPQLLRKNLELEQRAQQRARELATINEELQRDITQRKHAESALNASMELTERLIEALPGGVVQVAADGAIMRANPEALRILGLSYDELSRRYVSDFETETIFEDGSAAHPNDYPVAKAIATGLVQPATTIGVCKKNGEVSWAVYRAVPTRDLETQAVTGAVVTFFDITERKRFEDKLRHAQKLESLGVLAGGIAHDFNNLLVTILGNASLAKSLPACAPEIASLLEEVELGARRAADLTKQMLDYAGQGTFKLQPVGLPALVGEMAKLLKAMISKQIVLHYHIQDGLPQIEADSTQLRQVVMNLITNAAEAIGDRPGRVVVSVEEHTISAEELDQYDGDIAAPGSFVRLGVRDDGCGMAPATIARVFDPFFTTKFMGRGLGMAAVLGIVRSHRGAISIESREQEGTSVFVLLPARSRSVGVETGPLNGAGRGLILVVDDDEGVRAVTRAGLMSAGYQVITADNGLSGLQLFQQHAANVRLILLDVTMPVLNGFETLRRIRASGSTTPVLLSSGYNVEATAGAQSSGILVKPYDVTQLLASVARALC